VGLISGGAIVNIIPEHAQFSVEWRMVPGDDIGAAVDRLRTQVATAIEPAMHAVDPATGFTITPADWLPALSLDPDHELAGLVRQLTGSNSAGFVSYGTEAGLYQDAGIASIVCGPGDIAQAHQPDEWIAVSQLAACDAFLQRLAAHYAT
jgi:acetylornithine deacetylase